MLRKTLASALALPLLISACADSPDPSGPETGETSPLASGDHFVAIPRGVDLETSAKRRAALADTGAPMKRQRAAGSNDFYLAIHKDVLQEKYFLSAFLEQYFPGAVAGGAATSLGTRVISFEIQNDKLFVFDVDDRAQSSDTFDPQRIVEAFPLVTDKAITKLPGYKNYVFIDPAAGLNKFDVLGDAFGTPWSQIRFETELSFLQNFVKLADGASWDRVFTGFADWPIGDGTIEGNVFRASGTMSFALRRYQEGEHYVEVPLPPQEHYFRSDPKLVNNTGNIVQTAAHWDLYEGMEPIEWLISPELQQLDETPEYADVDLVGSVQRGVTGWNDVLGFEAFTTRVADPDESFSRDDLNYIIFDDDPSAGYAFANWRTNPNTGEIRGASVYFGSVWVDRGGFVDDEPAAAPSGNVPAPRTKVEHPKVPSLQWAGTANQPLCVMWAGDHGDELGAPAGSNQMTGAAKLEAMVTNMIAHEIGHDLGLRHNFKGSLVPPSSSVMEYSAWDDAIAQGGTAGSYDIAAIRYLYGLSSDLPTDPFCTDDHYGTDPDCRVFDTGADPLGTEWAGWWGAIRQAFLDWGLGYEYETFVDAYGAEVFDYAITGNDELANRALDIALEGIAAPLDPSAIESTPNLATTSDILLQRVLLAAANTNPAIAYRLDEQLSYVMYNTDGVRSARTRRVLVAGLKARQTLWAYRVLVDARAIAAVELENTTDGDTELQLRDLIATIDAAINPYFE